MSTAFLIVAVIGALFTVNAYRPMFRGGPLSIFSFFAGWLTSELPIQHIAWQVVATAAFILAGALDSWPGWLGLAITCVSWIGLAYLVVEANNARDIIEEALVEGLGPEYLSTIRPELLSKLEDRRPSLLQIIWPFAVRHRDVRRTRNITYGPAERRNRLDVYRRADGPTDCPVLLQVHGGAWVLGNKEQQGVPLMSHLASLGWVCVAINYRLSPRATWPDPIVDVKRAITWIKANIADYGGKPEFVVITGGSAGGHLASLAALTPNKRAWQPGFEDADTSVQACVPFYGVYDLLNRDGVGRNDMRRFLERMVFKVRGEEATPVLDEASPMSHVGPHAPPFFVVHGKNDTLVPVAQARLFARLLRAASREPVLYAELPGAQHAFEVFGSIRTGHVVRGVERFVAWVYSRWLETVGAAEAVSGERASGTARAPAPRGSPPSAGTGRSPRSS